MKSFLSEVSFTALEPMVVISAVAIGAEPEDFIIEKMGQLAQHYQLDVLRTFGFDSPVETTDVTTFRGYGLWLTVEKTEIDKLPDTEAFDFDGVSVTIKDIPPYRYGTLRIEDPMLDPFERIGAGWRYLMKGLEDQDIKSLDFKLFPEAHCLEEVKEVAGVTVMDIYIPIGSC